jgi:hypothetical protein
MITDTALKIVALVLFKESIEQVSQQISGKGFGKALL